MSTSDPVHSSPRAVVNAASRSLQFMEHKPVKVKNILYADIFRDGGSYGFGFDSDDGHQYEFFLLTTVFSAAQDTVIPPPNDRV